MDPEQFEIYGTRFRWFDEHAPSTAGQFCIPLIRKQQSLVPEDIAWLNPGGAGKPRYGKLGEGFLYRFDGTADFWLAADGSSVEAFLFREAQPWNLDFVLQRGIIPRVLHLRGTTCLHASAAVVGAGLAGFCGASGTGKSSLVAALAARGCAVVSDDVLPLGLAHSGVVAGPGLPEIRLHPAAVARLGLSSLVTGPRAGQTKAVWNPTAAAGLALPLTCLFLLQPGSGVPAARRQANPREALLTVLSNSFWLHPGETRGLASDLECFARLVRSVPVYHLDLDLSAIEEAAKLVVQATVDLQ